MVKFALAGAGKTVGKAIHQYLLENDSYDYIILSRTAKDDGRTIAVDYSNIEALAKVLNEQKIHTVVSTLSIGSDEGGQAQMNLIEASIQAETVHRFMPSEFGALYTKKYDTYPSLLNASPSKLTSQRWLATMPAFKWKFAAVERLAASRLEWTRFSNAMFMDYAFSPRLPSAFPETSFSLIDFENNVASIPGNGNTPVVYTHSSDVPKFVLKILELPKWDDRYFLVGDRLTFNEYVDLVEKVKGVKFERLYQPTDELEKGKVTLVPSMQTQLPVDFQKVSIELMMSALELQMANGLVDLPFKTEGTLLNDLFPELKTLKIKEALDLYFSKERQ